MAKLMKNEILVFFYIGSIDDNGDNDGDGAMVILEIQVENFEWLVIF